MKSRRLSAEQKFNAYLDFVSNGAVGIKKGRKSVDYLAERFAINNRFDLSLLEAARTKGRRKRYENCIDRMLDGQLHYENAARIIASDYGFNEDDINLALEYGRVERIKLTQEFKSCLQRLQLPSEGSYYRSVLDRALELAEIYHFSKGLIEGSVEIGTKRRINASLGWEAAPAPEPSAIEILKLLESTDVTAVGYAIVAESLPLMPASQLQALAPITETLAFITPEISTDVRTVEVSYFVEQRSFMQWLGDFLGIR